ncbi:dihydropteridine reductase [Bacillus manliponensis]|uniref:serine-type D-Ala-D-Ala carboxypeptidase n=1 Tax=Bacillus manliponensis TaxID=574376 RepID=A0A073K2Z4_9BACI|nr:penicillin-binding protein [Bacillus manliponensis]KEK20911.1 dihydropteridine reductase [Bacillus manliponensis]
MNMSKFHTNKGAGIFMIFVLLLFFLLFARFFYIQVTGTVHGEDLKELASEKHNKNGVLEANRGTIYDQNGHVLAQDTNSYRLTAALTGDKPVKDKEETAKKLAEHIDMSEEDILKQLNRKDKTQVEFGTAGKDLTKEQKKEIDDLELQGISFLTEKARVYPNGDFASYVIGHAKPKDDGIAEGMFGLEKSLDKYLRASNGSTSYVGSRGGIALEGGEGKVVPPKNGDNVYLTLDQRIQGFLEDAMKEAEERYKPEMLIGIVADPKTGKILAMSSTPSYDPNKRNLEHHFNDPIANAFEPGSTMKIFTLAAAINEGVYDGQAYFQSGTYPVGDRVIRDHNSGNGWGSITFDEGVLRSSNVAFAYLGEKLGEDRFRQYIHNFGLDEKTGIDLPGEQKNKILFDKKIEQVTTAFGQGSTVTPIQLVQATTAIANDGKMMKPYVVDQIVDPMNNKVKMDRTPEEVGQPITKETADHVRELLEQVVTSPKGTGGQYQIDDYAVGGKTGTAQIPDGKGGYMTGKENYIFSFLGMAPIDDPQLVVYVAAKQPKLKGNEYGSQPVAEIFKSVTKNSLEYLKIKPTEVKDPKKYVKEQQADVPDVTGMTMEEAKVTLEKEKFRPVILGEGQVKVQSPKAGEKTLKGDRIFLVGENPTMPNIVGWALRDVMNLAKTLHLELESSGTGYVTEQSIAEGTALKEGDVLRVNLIPPLQPQQEAEAEAEKPSE